MSTTPSGVRRLLRFLRPAPRTPLCLLFFALLAAASAGAQGLTYSGGPVDAGAGLAGQTINAGSISIATPSGATVITSATFTSDGAVNSEFGANSNTCTGAVTGPGTCSISLNFAPRQTGLRRGALTITSVGNTPLVIYLHGVGQGSQLAFSPDAASAISTVTPLQPIYYSATTSVYDGNGNVFFNDILNSRILEQSSAGTLSSVATLSGSIMSSLAISPTGTLFVSMPSNSKVYGVVPGASPAPITFTGATLSQPSGLAVDGSGYLYVADAASNRIVRSAFDGSAATVLPLTGLATPLSSPEGLTIDALGNLYVLDAGNQRIVKVVLSTGAASPFAVTGQLLYNSYGLTSDASGALYIADTGNRRILRITAAGVASVIQTPGFAFSSPTGVTLAANGDIIVADNNVGLTRIIRSSPSTSLTFNTPTPVGALDSTDGSKFVTLQNIGNTTLTFVTPTDSTTNPRSNNTAFSVTSSSSCPILTSASTTAGTLTSGSSCTYAVSFTPTAVGANTGSLIIADRPTGSATSASQTFPLSGTGLAMVDAFTLVATPSTTTNGTPETVTVTAFSGGLVSTSYRGTVTLASTDNAATFPGGATYTFTAADNGVHTFTGGVVFNNAGVFTVSATDGSVTASSNVVTVKQAVSTPTVSLAVTPNPAAAGATVTLTATLTSASTAKNAAAPTGTVTFYDGANAIATVAVAAGKATTTTTLLATGAAHSLTAVYNGDSLNLAATSSPIAEVVKLNPAITLAAAPNPAAINTTVALTATVSSTGSIAPTGTVSFYDSGVLLGSSALSAGRAALSVPFASSGAHSITATYNGDANFFTAASAAVIETIQVTPAVGLTATPNPVAINSPLALTATITGSGAAPTGTVTFFDGATAIATATVSGGKATASPTFATTGTRTITATYSGDTTYAAATSTAATVQVKAPASFAFTATPNPAAVNSPVTLTATVSSSLSTAPTGTVTFLDGTTVLGTVTVSGGAATLNPTFATPASHTFTATYSGDSTFLTATLMATVQVTQITPAVALTVSSGPVFILNATTFTATVAGANGTVPTGSVTFFDGLATLGAAPVSSGQASITTAFSSTGTHNITAVYSGDANFSAATAASASIVAEDFTIASVATANSASILPGSSATYTLNVTPVGGTTFPAAVVFTVSGLPPTATYTLTPSSTAAGAAAVAPVLVISVPQVTALQRPPASPFLHTAGRVGPIAFALLLLPFLRRRKRLLPLLSILLLAGAALGLTGCLSDQASGYFGQVPGTYTVTVTGTSGSLSHSANVTLTVQ